MYQLLSSLRVVEGAAFVAGPSCGLHLAQMGAEVIRFDAIGGGPDFSRWPLSPEGRSLYWEGLNKGKKSVALDLTSEAGRELAVAIATAPGEGAGLFVTNYPADGFLSHDRLKARRADLITLRVMGWADGGPAVDYTVNAAVGLPAMTGPEGSGEPVNHVLPAWDLLTGAYGAFALLAAERQRRAGGPGGEVRVPLSDMAAATLANLGQLAEVLAGEGERPRLGNSLFGAFGRDFRTPDGRVMVVAITPRQWTGLLAALGLAEAVRSLELELSTDFAADEGARFRHRARLFPLFEAAFAEADMSRLKPVFHARGVCWSPYQTLKEAAADPRLYAGNPVFSEIEHPSGLRYPAPGAAATLPHLPRGDARPAPRLGQHTEEVLADVLGLPDGEIGRLRSAGVVAWPEGGAR